MVRTAPFRASRSPRDEIKYDGYRMMVVRENDRVRLISRNGNDWTDRYLCVPKTLNSTIVVVKSAKDGA
jgi:ATP-dependent DNA ligase